MVQNNKCSVLVPAYNEEKNIANCLNNILKQSYDNIEILVIDDGSTDNTAVIVNEFIKSHTNIKYIYQQNKGAADARRNGLNQCITEYVTFLDADDLFSLDAIESAMNEFNDDVDMVLYRLAISQDTRNSEFNYLEYFTQEKQFTGISAFENCLYGWKAHGYGIFRKTVFLKSYFEYDKYNSTSENWINNDEVITRFNFYYSKNIRVSDGIYFYNRNLNSTTKGLNRNFYKILNNTGVIIKFCRNNNIQADEVKILFDAVQFIEMKFKEWRKNLPNIKTWKKVLRCNLKKLFLINNSNSNSKIRFKIRYKCFRHFVRFLF